jgi:hypothetical protein
LEILVCPNCGAVIKPKNQGCAACGAAQSNFAATQVATLAQPAPPMIVSVAPDRLILERIVANRQVIALVPSLATPQHSAYDEPVPDSMSMDGSSSQAFPDFSSSSLFSFTDLSQTPGLFDFAGVSSEDAREGTANGGDGDQSSHDYARQTSTGSFPLEGIAYAQSRDAGVEAVQTIQPPQPVALDRDAAAPWEQDPDQYAIEENPDIKAIDTPFATQAEQTASTFFQESSKPEQAQQPEPIPLEQPAPVMVQPAATTAPADQSNQVEPANARPKVAMPQLASAKSSQAFDFFSENNGPKSGSKANRPKRYEENAEAHSSFEDLLKRNTKSNPSATIDESQSKGGLKSQASRSAFLDNGDMQDPDDDDAPTVRVDKINKSKVMDLAKSKAKKAKSDLDDDDDNLDSDSQNQEEFDEDDDLDDDDQDDTPPKRRSFSGSDYNQAPKSSTRLKDRALARQKPGSKRHANDDDDEQDDDQDADEDDDDEAGNSRAKKGKSAIGKRKAPSKMRGNTGSGGLFTVAGFPIGPKLIAISACIVAALFFAISHVVSNVASVGLTNPAALRLPSLPQTPKVAGVWTLIARQKQQNYPGTIQLKQQGFALNGQGNDSIGTFKLQGSLTPPNKIELKKQYVDRNMRPSGVPIFFGGLVDFEAVPMQAKGVWQLTRKSGSQFSYLNKSRSETVSGQWVATLRQAMPVEEGGLPIPTMAMSNGSTPGISAQTGTTNSGKFNIIDFMGKYGIIVVIGVGIAVVGGVFSLFGPNGLINVWNKKKYIPSQFKSQHDKVKAQLAKPMKKGSLPLGQRVEWNWYTGWLPWVVKDLNLPPELRKANPHLLILGQGGKGKSRLIAHMLMQDIISDDRCVVAIDSDGSLVDLITTTISAHPRGKEIARRVVLIDPTNKKNKNAYNPLELLKEGDIQTAAASIVYGFKAIYTEPPGSQSQWNAQTADILRNAVLLLMANGKTLTDLPNLLNDNDFRDILLENVERKKDSRIEFNTLLDQWSRYKKLARTDQWITWVEPILNRVNPMLSNPRIRNILTRPDGDLKLLDVITKKKILLVKIPQGEFGQDANLLGSLVVAGIKQAALTLSSSGSKAQQPVSLYLDNFDSFIEQETLENITSETKKFKIGFIGVTKSLQHLPEDFRNNLIINIGTLITFALSKKDGDLLGPQMFPIDGRKVKHQTMSNLFNPINSSPQFELVSDEEKLNIDKIVRQEERTFFCYRMGAEAGLFNLKSHDINDVPDNKINHKLIERMHFSPSKKREEAQ